MWGGSQHKDDASATMGGALNVAEIIIATLCTTDNRWLMEPWNLP